MTFDPASPVTPTAVQIDGGRTLHGVACPSISQCTAVDNNGGEVTFNPTSPGALSQRVIDSGRDLRAVFVPVDERLHCGGWGRQGD